MKAERREEVERLYEAALEREPEEREAFLDRECRGDEELRHEVASLLGYASRAGDFIETPALGVAARAAGEPQPRLKAGARLGPYEVLAPLGAGGMGEVYVARDTRLKRKVALKVLPEVFARDSERVRRFEREARTAGSLDHPNLLAVHDVGQHDGSPYLVAELLEGQTLRERIHGRPLPQRKALHYAVQIARGLAAAHDKGVVHRDLKPENLFVTKDGRVKILDFGLAKLVEGEITTDGPTLTAGTESGVVMGTVTYMSPEQARGEPVDARSDIFAFGAILYEMLTGRAVFGRSSKAETLSAILNDEPPPMEADTGAIPARLDRIVRHCLEKHPDERFQSARDLAFDLEALSQPSGAHLAPAPIPSGRRWPRTLAAGLAVLAAVAVFFAGFGVGRRTAGTSATETTAAQQPTFRQLTFRRGTVHAARFAPDGRTFVYTANWDGQGPETYLASPEFPDARPLGLPGSDLTAISPSGQLAILINGTLAYVPITGGVPRETIEGVQSADWAPDNSAVAVVRAAGSGSRLECPLGNVLYETAGQIDNLRVSPDGNAVAFFEHPIRNDDRGGVVIVGRDGRVVARSEEWSGGDGLAWTPAGDEVWFTASGFTASGIENFRALRAMTTEGKVRLLLSTPGMLTLRDISRDGRVLLERSAVRYGIMCLAPGETKERDLSWLDRSANPDISADGTTLLFWEFGDGAGPGTAVCLRKTDGSPPVRLGEGQSIALSPDGQLALAATGFPVPTRLVLIRTGAGQTRKLETGSIGEYQGTGCWLPDGKRILFAAKERDGGLQVYVQDVDGGPPRPVTPTGFTLYGRGAASPDGKLFVAFDNERNGWLFPVDGGDPKPIPGLTPNDAPSQWSADGRGLIVCRFGAPSLEAFRLDLATGRREIWKESSFADPAGIRATGSIRSTPDGRAYAYHYQRILSDLFLVEGLK
jgi:serine/threonine protein kinase/Tol biopolymer transport system component